MKFQIVKLIIFLSSSFFNNLKRKFLEIAEAVELSWESEEL